MQDVCAYVMGALPLVPARHSQSLERLRVVMRAAQRRFQTVDKRVTVRVVDVTGGVRTEHAPIAHTVNGDKTVQQAVRETYPAFPSACQRVVLRRLGLDLWDRSPHGCAFYSGDRYATIREGDEIDIEVQIEKPEGPQFLYATMPGPVAHYSAVRGPQARMLEVVHMQTLLDKMRQLTSL